LLRKLPGHGNFVKGVAWDPVGKYMSTQSDDRSLLIWATNGAPSEWEVEKKVTEPFTHSTGGTWFTRLDWSPEGSYLCAPTAVSEGVDVATLLDRKQDWRSDLHLVGHLTPVEVARFCPVMFRHGEGAPFSVVATGSEDGTVSIWSTAHKVAMVALEGCFTGPIHDLTWSPDGRLLVACSQDGYAAVVRFGETELGHGIVAAEMESMMAKYGFRRKKEAVPEGAMQLDLEAQRVPEAFQANGAVPMLLDEPRRVQPIHVSAAMTTLVQRTKDGKKRVQPTFVRGLTGDDEPSVSVQDVASPSKGIAHSGQLPQANMSAMVGGLEWREISNFVAQAKANLTIVHTQVMLRMPTVEDRLSCTVSRSEGQGQVVTLLECRNDRGKGTFHAFKFGFHA